MLEVTDTGSGIDQETVELHIRAVFHDQRDGRSTGFGLAIVYGMVKQRNGHITLSSEVGKGTTFRVYQPTTPADVELEVEGSGIMPAFAKGVILLVDHEESLSEPGARILTQYGYTVLQAVNGRERLDIFKKGSSEECSHSPYIEDTLRIP